eukprot:1544268-Rhodomonas_salina.2
MGHLSTGQRVGKCLAWTVSECRKWPSWYCTARSTWTPKGMPKIGKGCQKYTARARAGCEKDAKNTPRVQPELWPDPQPPRHKGEVRDLPERV